MTTPARHPNGRPSAALPLAAVLCLAGGPAPAASMPTVADLRGQCAATMAFTAVGDSREAEVPAVRCFSYLEGMARILDLNCRLARLGEVAGMLPAADIAGAATADLVRAFLAWAVRHPEAAGEHESVAGVAIVEAFPCAARTAT